MTTARRVRRGLLLFPLLGLLSTGTVLADHEPARLGLEPIGEDRGFFDLKLEPGDSVRLEVALTNHGHAPVLVRTYLADAYSIVNGGFGARLADEPTSGTTLWIDYPSREVNLGTGAGTTIAFQLSVPAGTPPGEYIAALVAENAEPFREEAGDVGLDQVNRVALAVAIDVPGRRRPALDIGSLSHRVVTGVSLLSFGISNPGNVHLRPGGTVWLREGSGAELMEAPAVMDSVYAGSDTSFEITLGTLLAPGDYCAELSLVDPETGAADRTECEPFRVEAQTAESAAPGSGVDRGRDGGLPLVLVVIFGPFLALLAVGLIVLLARRRRRRDDERMPA